MVHAILKRTAILLIFPAMAWGSSIFSPGASGPFINLQNTLQTGATFYVSSGTANAFYCGSCTLRNVTSSLLAADGTGMIVSTPSFSYNPVNVLAVGAKGDGSTDDATAIQNAIAVSSSVFLPCGVYVIGAGLTMNNRSNFAMIGSGPCSVLSQKASTSMTVITVSTSTDIFLSNFQINGNDASQANDGTSRGILVNFTSSRVILDQLTLQNQDGNAIEFKNQFDPSSAFDNVVQNCNINEHATNSAGIKALNPQQSMKIIGNTVYTGGNGESAQVEVSSSVISNNVFIASASIALTLNGGQAYGENGVNIVSNNQLYGADIALELGNVNGLTVVSGNHIEQQWHGAASESVGFTGTGVFSSSNVVFTGNVIVASRTLVAFGSNPSQTTWNGNIFRRNNPNNTANWFTGSPTNDAFIGNFFDGENMVGTYDIWNNNLSNVAFIGNVFNCGVGTTSTAIAPTSLGSAVSATYFGNQYVNCTNGFVSGGFDYQIGDEVRSAVSAVNCASNIWGDATSIALTQGVWSISAIGVFGLNGSTNTGTILGISKVSGNSAAGLVMGDNWINAGPPPVNDITLSIPAWRTAIATSGETVYLKNQCSTSVGTTKLDGARLSAIRIQ